MYTSFPLVRGGVGRKAEGQARAAWEGRKATIPPQ